MLNQEPRQAPCLAMTSRAYWEQLGVKRQVGGMSGLSMYWYKPINLINNCRITFEQPATVAARLIVLLLSFLGLIAAWPAPPRPMDKLQENSA